MNGSFEEADFTGWTVTNIDNVTEELNIYDRDTDCFDGVQSLHFYSGSNNVDFYAEQKVSGLEEGSYKLTAHIQGCLLYTSTIPTLYGNVKCKIKEGTQSGCKIKFYLHAAYSLNFCFASSLRCLGTCICTVAYWSPYLEEFLIGGDVYKRQLLYTSISQNT